MTRLLRRLGPSTARVDPRWDFEHDGPWDPLARRLERLRVPVPGPEPAEVRLRLVREDGEDLVDLPIGEHVWRFAGGTASSPEAYSTALPRFAAPPPFVIVALDVTHLSPGDHALVATVPGCEPVGLHVEVVRRPFFSVPAGVAAERFAVRSATGVGRAEQDGAIVVATAHRWRLARHAWVASGRLRGRYEADGAVDVAAITVFDAALAPVATRWRELAPGEVLDADALLGEGGLAALRPPRDHADGERGYGLPFPELVGLATQPGPDGAHGAG